MVDKMKDTVYMPYRPPVAAYITTLDLPKKIILNQNLYFGFLTNYTSNAAYITPIIQRYPV